MKTGGRRLVERWMVRSQLSSLVSAIDVGGASPEPGKLN